MQISKLKDNQLVWRMKARKCDQCLLELIGRHEKLFFKISQRYFPASLFRNGQSVEDLIGSRESIIYECAINYRSHRKVKFSTWVGNFVRYKCLNYLNKNSRYINMEDDSLHYMLNSKSLEEHSKLKKEEDFDYVFNILKQMKDPRIRKVFDLRYLSGEKKKTWGEIGEEMNISSQTAINLHNKGKGIIAKKMTSERYADKII